MTVIDEQGRPDAVTVREPRIEQRHVDRDRAGRDPRRSGGRQTGHADDRSTWTPASSIAATARSASPASSSTKRVAASGTVTSPDGVDINRNYGYQWGFDNVGSSPSIDAQSYRGPAPFSEPETQAQREIVAALQPKTGLSFHTYSDLYVRPWGYTTTAPQDSSAFYEWEDDMSLGNGYTAGQGIRILYAVNGEFNDWAYGDQVLKPRAFTWTPEIGGPNDSFWPAPSRIVPLAEENLRGSYYVASIAGPYVRVERSNVIGGPLVAASSR